MPMGFEIEFFPVGDGTKAGDAITVRYGGDDGQYSIIVIDGGTDASGEAIVAHVKGIYGTDTVAHVISTHPDSDHSGGLRTIMNTLNVQNLWIHGLWHHAGEILPLFANPQLTAEGLTRTMRSEYPIVVELIDTAVKRGTAVYEPFAGQQIGPFRVLSPNRLTYQHLLPQFRKTPDPNVGLLRQRNIWLGDVKKQSIFSQIMEKAAEVASNWIPEAWHIELLKEGGITAAENESSVVLFGDFWGERVLLTADAGVNALNWACANAPGFGIDISATGLVQVPHHGSRRNVSPSVLNKLLGSPLPAGSPERRKAIVSAPKDDDKHPRKMVLNAFTRRGAGVRSTQGVKFRYHSNMPLRSNERQADVLGFFEKVEAYD